MKRSFFFSVYPLPFHSRPQLHSVALHLNNRSVGYYFPTLGRYTCQFIAPHPVRNGTNLESQVNLPKSTVCQNTSSYSFRRCERHASRCKRRPSLPLEIITNYRRVSQGSQPYTAIGLIYDSGFCEVRKQKRAPHRSKAPTRTVNKHAAL